MGALSTVQTTVFDIAYFLGIPTLQHLLHEAIIVARIVARVDALEPVQVCRKDLFEDTPSWRGFCHHQAASLRDVGLCVVARFCHVPPTQSTPASANTRRRSPTCLALEPQWREGNPQMKIPRRSSIACCEVWRHTPARPEGALPQSRCYMAFQSPACSNA
jgi:hypothetical protein